MKCATVIACLLLCVSSYCQQSTQKIPEPEMIFVHGGRFLMGKEKDDNDNAPHIVAVSSFYIGKTDITQKEWMEVMGYNPSHHRGCDYCPVDSVDFYDATAFIAKLNRLTGKNYRLPTEAEWEFAARGGLSGWTHLHKFSGGNNPDKLAWHKGNSRGMSHSVMTKRPNQLGIYDMTGNVAQWCNDWYDKDGYLMKNQLDPQGPADGGLKIMRGGSWFDAPRFCEVTFRTGIQPWNKQSTNGFRVARSVSE